MTQTPSPADGPNREQAQYWNEQAGPKWVALEDALDGMIRPLGERAMERAELAPGQRVLDVGCGCGQTTLELARRVGAQGHVLGVDVSAPMLARARERAAAAGLDHVEFRQADAQSADLGDARAERLFSRFGVMFFADPAAAFENLHKAVVPGGRLDFVCWNEVGKNPWMLEPARAVAQHVEMPAPGDPHAPGPFAFADPERVRGILSSGGFSSIEIDPCNMDIQIGGDGGVEAFIDFTLQMGPAGAALQASGVTDLEPIRATLREIATRYERGGVVQMPCAAWLVSARS